MIIQPKTTPKPGEVIYLVDDKAKVKVADATLNSQKPSPRQVSVVSSNDTANNTRNTRVTPEWVIVASVILSLLWQACKWVLKNAFTLVLFVGKSIFEYGLDRMANNQQVRRFNADMVSARINRKADAIRANNNYVPPPVEFTYQGEPFSLDLTVQEQELKKK